MCHVYVRGDNLAGVLISDHDYPHRVSHTLLTKVIASFNTVFIVFDGKDKVIIVNYNSSSPVQARKILITQIVNPERYVCVIIIIHML
jgi:hypothetical protein